MLTLWQTQRRQEAISAGITKDGLRQESVKLRDVPSYSKLRSVGRRRIAHKAVSIDQSGFGGGTLRSEQRRILQRRTNKKPLSDTRLRGFSLSWRRAKKRPNGDADSIAHSAVSRNRSGPKVTYKSLSDLAANSCKHPEKCESGQKTGT